jgi:predicted O-methyltransferase YrrM
MKIENENEVIGIIEKYWFEKGHLNLDQRDYFIEKLSILKPKYCLEIGFASGHSAITTLIAAKPERLVSVDLSLDYIPGARRHAELLQKEFSSFIVVEGNSKIVLNDVFFGKYFTKKIDFAFVDGDHSYKGCLADLKLIWPHLSPKGIVFVDDYKSGPPNGVIFNAVTRAVDDFVLNNRKLAIEYWSKNGKGIALIKNYESKRERIKTIKNILIWRIGWLVTTMIAFLKRIYKY